MSVVLCLGDSLTAGSLGFSWLRALESRAEMSLFELINAGENGFTMEGLENRLKEFLEKETTPGILILEGGANDLLLPHMQSSGKSWDPFIRKLFRSGSPPAASAADFELCLKRIIRTAEAAGIRKTISCTIPCLGENLDSPLNRRREAYNRIIRGNSALCADTASLFEDILRARRNHSSHLFQSPEELERDALFIQREGMEELSRERGLHLTIDGAHLNERGASLFADEVERNLIH